MRLIDDTLYIPFAECVGAGIKPNTISVGISRKEPHWQSIKDPSDRRARLIRWDTMKPEYQAKVRNHLGHEPLSAAQNAVISTENDRQNALKTALKAAVQHHYRHEMRHFANLGLNIATQEGYARAAAVLRVAQAGGGAYGYARAGEFQKAVCKELGQMGIPQAKWTDPQTLRRKLREAEKGVHLAVYSGKIGNDNRRLAAARELEALAIATAGECDNPNPQKVWNLLVDKVGYHNDTRPAERWEVPSVSWVKALLRRPDVVQMTALSRLGAKAYNDQFVPYIKRERAKAFGNVWWMDGSPLNQYHTGPEGKLARFNLYIVVDDCTGMIVGFSIGYAEDWRAVRDALAVAVQATGILPAEINADNHGAWKSEEGEIGALKRRMVQLGTVLNYAEVGNAQSKGVVESRFKHLQNLGKGVRGFLGDGLLSRDKYGHISPELTNYFLKHPLTADEARQAVLGVLLAYNQKPRGKAKLTPLAAMEASPKGHAIGVQEHDMARIFWPHTTVLVHRGCVMFETKGKDYAYMVDPHTVLHWAGKQVRVCYAPGIEDRHRALLFCPATDTLLGEARRIDPVQVMQRDRTGTDWQSLKAQVNHREAYKELLQQKRAAIANTLLQPGVAEAYARTAHIQPKERTHEMEVKMLGLLAGLNPDMGQLEAIMPERFIAATPLNQPTAEPALLNDGPATKRRARELAPVAMLAGNDRNGPSLYGRKR